MLYAYHPSCMLIIPLVCLLSFLNAYYPSCMRIIPLVCLLSHMYAYSPSCLLTVYYPFSVLIFPLVCFFLCGLPFCMYYCTVYIVLDEKKILKMLFLFKDKQSHLGGLVCWNKLLYLIKLWIYLWIVHYKMVLKNLKCTTNCVGNLFCSSIWKMLYEK